MPDSGWPLSVQFSQLTMAPSGNHFHTSAQGDPAMATYVTLIKFTEKGVKDIKDTCKRAADFKSSAAKLGVEVRDTLWCQGAYDGVLVFTAADDEAATAAMLSLSTHGNVTTQTMRSFNATEMNKVLGKVS
jgi:uncharacterized protein with GYD domain